MLPHPRTHTSTNENEKQQDGKNQLICLHFDELIVVIEIVKATKELWIMDDE